MSSVVRSPSLAWMAKAMRQMAAATHMRHCRPPASCLANLTYSGVPRGGRSALGPSRSSSSAARLADRPWDRGVGRGGAGDFPPYAHPKGSPLPRFHFPSSVCPAPSHLFVSWFLPPVSPFFLHLSLCLSLLTHLSVCLSPAALSVFVSTFSVLLSLFIYSSLHLCV